MLQLRNLAYRANSAYWRVRTAGRMGGHEFYPGRPMRVRLRGTRAFYLGRGTHIDAGARIVHVAGNVHVGENVLIGKNSTIVAHADLVVGDRTLIGENVSIHTEDHGPVGQRENFSVEAVYIGKDVWIGAGVVITRGVTIGDGATVGANAVVTRDVAAKSLVAGIPARFIRAL